MTIVLAFKMLLLSILLNLCKIYQLCSYCRDIEHEALLHIVNPVFSTWWMFLHLMLWCWRTNQHYSKLNSINVPCINPLRICECSVFRACSTLGVKLSSFVHTPLHLSAPTTALQYCINCNSRCSVFRWVAVENDQYTLVMKRRCNEVWMQL